MNEQSIRALIVDDSEDDTLLLVRGLKKNGYNPFYERVDTSAAMKKALKDNRWDIIFCDYKMPTFSGPLAIALLKETKMDLPLIIVSGAIDETTAVECMRLGAKDYVLKTNYDRLYPVIARELEDAKVRKKQRRIEEKLHREEKRFRAYVEHSSDIFVIVNLEGTITYINPAVEQVLGFKPEERIGSTGFEFVHPEDMKFLTDSFNTLATDTNSPVIHGAMRLRHKNGSWRSFEAVGSNLVINNVIESIIVNYRDITEREKAQTAIKLSEEKFAASFLKSPIPMAITAVKDGRFVDANEAFAKVMGLQREELIGKTSIGSGYIAAEERAIFLDEYRKKGAVENLKLQIRVKGGDWRYGLFNSSKITIGEEEFFLTQVMDITEHKPPENASRKKELK
jgi:PAS domain S-box-containing protein